MSGLIFLTICSTLLVCITLTALFILIRTAHKSPQPRLRWMPLALYLCSLFSTHLFLWWGDREDVLLMTMLFGMPWSLIGLLVTRELFHLYSDISFTIISLGGIGINIWLSYYVGQRLSLPVKSTSRVTTE